MVKLGFIGFGEAASNLAEGLLGEGLLGVIAYDKNWNTEPYGKLIRDKAATARVRLVQDFRELVSKSDIIISAVSADLAVELAGQTLPFLNADKIYVDINATSPMTKEEVAAVLSPVAPLFVDAAVMGPVPTYKHQVPILASGEGAGAFAEAMKPYGMQITLLERPAGSASATKTFRSIFMKGFVTLLLEMLVAAERYDVADEVLLSVVKTMTSSPLPEVINGLVCRGVVHSQRREHEMAEVVTTLDSIGIDSIMSRATIDKLRWCTSLGLKEHFRGVPPGDFHEIFTALKAEETGQ